MEGAASTPKPNTRRPWRRVWKWLQEDGLAVVFAGMSAVAGLLFFILVVLWVGFSCRMLVEAFRWGYHVFGWW